MRLHDPLLCTLPSHANLGGRFGYFLFFCFCSGRAKGESEAPGGGRFLIENPRLMGGFSSRPMGPGGCLRRVGEFGGGGGEAKFFFFGAEMSTKLLIYCGVQNNSVSGLLFLNYLQYFFSRIGPAGEYLP